jgi:hypothetical protein
LWYCYLNKYKENSIPIACFTTGWKREKREGIGDDEFLHKEKKRGKREE